MFDSKKNVFKVFSTHLLTVLTTCVIMYGVRVDSHVGNRLLI